MRTSRLTRSRAKRAPATTSSLPPAASSSSAASMPRPWRRSPSKPATQKEPSTRTTQARTISSSPCSRALRRAGEGVRGDRRGRRRRRGDVHLSPASCWAYAQAGRWPLLSEFSAATSRDAALRERLAQARERFLDSVAETIDGLGRRLGLARSPHTMLRRTARCSAAWPNGEIDPSLARDEVFEELFAACLRGLLVPTEGAR